MGTLVELRRKEYPVIAAKLRTTHAEKNIILQKTDEALSFILLSMRVIAQEAGCIIGINHI